MNDLTQSDVIGLLFYGVVALIVAGSIPRLFRGRFIAGLTALTVWIAIFLAALTGYAYRTELSGVAARVIATVVPGIPIGTGRKEVTIIRASTGEFVVRAIVGAARLRLVLDTGASTVVLRAEDAGRLGILTAALTYDTEVMTANGRALAAGAVLPKFAVGDVVERDVPVLIARSGSLHENLLGMSFLNRLAGYSVMGDKLVLRGR